jgi:lipopolysaccharide export LptBFGC system permease protein LptF
MPPESDELSKPRRARWIRGLTILDRYLLRRFALTYLANLISFTGLFVLIDAVSNIERFAERTDGPLQIFVAMAKSYVALVPPIYCEVLGPVVAASAAMFTVTLLQRANEFTPILAAGRGFQRSLAPILCAGAVLSLGVFLVQELWIPRTTQLIRDADLHRKGDGTYKNFTFPDREHGNVITFLEYDSRVGVARGVRILPAFRTPDRGHERLVMARRARWLPKQETWRLEDVTIQEYGPNGLIVPPGPPGAATRPLFTPVEELLLETELVPDDIESANKASATMSLGAVRHKAEKSLDKRAWRVRYLARFTNPLSNFILILVGLPIMVYFGSRNIFVGAILAVSVCAAYFGLNETFKDLGIRGILPARLGAVVAPVFFTALGWTVYREMRS